MYFSLGLPTEHLSKAKYNFNQKELFSLKKKSRFFSAFRFYFELNENYIPSRSDKAK